MDVWVYSMPYHNIPWLNLSVNFVKMYKSVEQIKCFDACARQTSMLSNWTIWNVIYISVAKCLCVCARCITTRAKNLATAHLVSLAAATSKRELKTRNVWQIFLPRLLNPKPNEWLNEWLKENTVTINYTAFCGPFMAFENFNFF